jgi:type II secretory pathway predicted ATPase ExeA
VEALKADSPMIDSELRNARDIHAAEPIRTGRVSATRGNINRAFLDHFGLREQPFGVTPDVRFLYFGSQHRQALNALHYGTELHRGFLTLIAQPGMGKTSLLYHYLEALRGAARTVFLFQTDANATELMRYLLADLGLDAKGMDLPEMRAALGQILQGETQQGRRFVLVIDEAQNLEEKTLESIRLLSNFETPGMKLLHIILAGQPQLAELLGKPSMAQLRQRVSFAIRIEPFSREEVGLYLDHRLRVAGYSGAQLFSTTARTLLAPRSEGIPRNINNICFAALLLAWATRRRVIDRELMRDVLSELDPVPQSEIDRHAPAPPKKSQWGGSQVDYAMACPKTSAARGSSQLQAVLLRAARFIACCLAFQRNVLGRFANWFRETSRFAGRAVISCAARRVRGCTPSRGPGGVVAQPVSSTRSTKK